MINYQVNFYPLKFQREAIAKWNTIHKGVVIAPTGAGKTIIGMMAITEQKQEINKILIVVPTITLAKQWKAELIKSFVYPEVEKNIYIVGDGTSIELIETNINSNVSPLVIVIAVVNSIRFKILKFDLVILDEFHRYFSRCNHSFLPISDFTQILGLTATLKQEKLRDWEFFRQLPIVVEISHRDVYREGLICNFFVRNVPLDLTLEEMNRSIGLTERIKSKMRLFNFNFGLMQSAAQRGDVSAIIGCRAIGERKELLFNSPARIPVVIRICDMHLGEKIIIFSETIENCNIIAGKLHERGDREIFVFHSDMTKEEKKTIISDFGSKPNSILCSVKALDEGLNVPEASVGIIASGSSTRRQFIQRLGRVIRGIPGKTAFLYQLYFRNTKDEDWMNARSDGIDSVIYNI